MTPAHIHPAVLRWARESAGYDLDQAASKARLSPKKLAAAEEGEALLTLRQAEEAARAFRRPLAVLFLSKPPVEEPIENQFRRLPDAPAPPWPPEMRLLARAIAERQAAAEHLLDELEQSAPWEDVRIPFVPGPEAFAERVRARLDVGLDEQFGWRDRQGFRPLRVWRDAIEELGVLVMQNGSLPVEAMRGFAALHPRVPGIVLNTHDDPRARCFTLLHELGHLLRIRAGVSDDADVESWCEALAAGVLMPAQPFSSVLSGNRANSETLLEAVDETALTFGVTPAAATTRAGTLRLASRAEIDELRRALRVRGPGRRSSGGDHYGNVVARLGRGFTRLVFSALDADAITSAGAAALLGTKVDGFPKLRARVGDPTGEE